MRIAYIAPYQGPGLLKRRPSLINLGLAANVKMELVAELLHRQSHEIEILSQGEVVERRLHFYPGFSEPEPFHSEIPVDYASALPVRFLNGLWSAFRILRLFKRRHRIRPYDAVIIYNLKVPQMMAALYAIRRLGLPVVLEYEDDALVDIRGKKESGHKAALYSRLATTVLNSVSGAIGASPYLLSLMPSTVPKVLLRGVITNDILTGRTTKSRKPWVVFSGTFSRAKGLEQLIHAWDMVNLPGWELHIAGHGEKADVLKKMAAHHRSIVFHGLLNRAENAEFLRTATIGINPHDVSETPGNVFAFKIIEYLAAGTHVITTRMGPLESELERGITYMPDNSPATIAATIRRAIQEQQYLRTASEAAEQMYGPEAVGKSLNALVQQVRTAPPGSLAPLRAAS